jgi:hypothetical protein
MIDLLSITVCVIAGYVIGRHAGTRDAAKLLAFLMQHGEIRPDAVQRAIRRERETRGWP